MNRQGNRYISILLSIPEKNFDGFVINSLDFVKTLNPLSQKNSIEYR